MNVPIKSIVPDVNQPRKHFDATKLRSLRESVKENGIINPLIVEKVGEKYLLVDGERRFRVALELDLKEVPIIVTKSANDIERLIRQFHVQEQHAEWTPLEKASALVELSTRLKISIREVCEMMNMGKSEKDAYVAFASVADKALFVKNEIPMHYARAFASLGNFAKKLTELDLEETFILSDQKRLEGALVRSIKNGSIERPQDIIKLKDSFKKNPKLIAKFAEEKDSTPQSLFIESKARGAYYLRNLLQASRYVANYGHRFIENNDVKVRPEELEVLVRTLDVLKEVVKVIE